VTNEQFVQMQQTLLEEATWLGSQKAREYAQTGDRFANFREAAAAAGISVGQSIVVYLVKTWRSVQAFVRNDGDIEMNEPFTERIQDMINYLTILWVWYRHVEGKGTPRRDAKQVGSTVGRTVHECHNCAQAETEDLETVQSVGTPEGLLDVHG